MQSSKVAKYRTQAMELAENQKQHIEGRYKASKTRKSNDKITNGQIIKRKTSEIRTSMTMHRNGKVLNAKYCSEMNDIKSEYSK